MEMQVLNMLEMVILSLCIASGIAPVLGTGNRPQHNALSHTVEQTDE